MQVQDQNINRKKGALRSTSLSWPKKLLYAAILTVPIEWFFIYLKYGEIFRPLSWDLGIELIFSYTYFVSLFWIYPHISAFLHSEKIFRLKTQVINLIEGISVVLATLILTLLTKLIPIWLILLVLNKVYGITAIFDEEAVRRNIVLHAILGLFFYYFVERERIKRRIRAEHLRFAELQKEEFRGQLEHLEDQVNPRFLFRSLETLEDLIQKDQKEASTYVNNLSSLYRSFLNQKEQLVSLKEEIDAARAYHELLKIHFKNSLSIRFEISEASLILQIPPGSVYMILEHMISSEISLPKQDMTIDITSEEGRLKIICNNPELKTEGFAEKSVEKIEEKYRFLTTETIEINRLKGGLEIKLPLLQAEAEGINFK